MPPGHHDGPAPVPPVPPPGPARSTGRLSGGLSHHDRDPPANHDDRPGPAGPGRGPTAVAAAVLRVSDGADRRLRQGLSGLISAISQRDGGSYRSQKVLVSYRTPSHRSARANRNEREKCSRPTKFFPTLIDSSIVLFDMTQFEEVDVMLRYIARSSPHGSPFSDFLVQESRDQLLSDMMSFPLLRKALLCLSDTDGQLVYHKLASDHSHFFLRLLRIVDSGEEIAILSAVNVQSEQPVAIALALRSPDTIPILIQARPQLSMALSNISDFDGFLVYHILAHGDHAFLGQIVMDLDEELAINVMIASNRKNKTPVSCYFAEMNPKIFVRVILHRDRLRAAVFSIADSEGRSPFHILALKHRLDYLEMLGQLGTSEAVAIFESENQKSKVPEAAIAITGNMAGFRHFSRVLPALLSSVLRMPDSEGWLLYHKITREDDFKDYLLEIDEADAATILGARNQQNRKAVAHLLAERNPRALARLAASRPLVRRALLDVADGDGLLPFHHLAAHHPASFLEMLLGLTDPDALELLLARNARTSEAVLVALSRAQPTALTRLIRDRPQLGAELLAFRDADGCALRPVGDPAEGRLALQLGAPGLPGTLDLPLLLSHVRFAAASGREIGPEGLRRLLAACGAEADAYAAALRTYSEAQRSDIMRLLETIRGLVEGYADGPEAAAAAAAAGAGAVRGEPPPCDGPAELVADGAPAGEGARAAAVWAGAGAAAVLEELRCALGDVRCFPDHYQHLLDICHLSGLRMGRRDPVLAALVRELWRFVAAELRPGVVAAVTRRVFGGAPDGMGTHADNCAARALDRLYGLFGGGTADDLFCPASNLVCRLVHDVAQAGEEKGGGGGGGRERAGGKE